MEIEHTAADISNKFKSIMSPWVTFPKIVIACLEMLTARKQLP